MDLFDELIGLLLSGEIQTREDLQRAKIRLCRKYSVADLPRNSEILAKIPEANAKELRHLLVKKPQRTLSGVAVVAVMTRPSPCPHGKCLYCPGGVEYGTPQSYTGKEPAALRAARHSFDPYRQVRDRIKQLQNVGHSTDKVDLIAMGGTFTAFDEEYQRDFIKRCFDALNGEVSPNLEEAQRRNETARSRCIGLTIETRPDCFLDDDVKRSLSFGVTRVELGVQTTNEEVLHDVLRGHGVKEVKDATERAKNAGLKVCYHLMPGLPGMTPRDDLDSFKEIFDNPAYRPDMLKIYPTAVVKGTGLYDRWRRGEFEPYDTQTVAELIATIKSLTPPWVRIQRIQRDIPIPLTVGGVRKGHLRELARELLRGRGKRCNCIRCREVGRLVDNQDLSIEDADLVRREYKSSGSTEIFLSLEEGDVLFGYARLRKCLDVARLRELKVLGELVPFDEKPASRWQHQGIGTLLLEECERIARDEWNADYFHVTSGVGALKYYEMFLFSRCGPYMCKSL
ncbi:MAG: tRNA uridine(34) 5-carboxymethylaminomethyl modification radical SAM/GNAT enzyme Elp3 [Thermoplasmata archaeon]